MHFLRFNNAVPGMSIPGVVVPVRGVIPVAPVAYQVILESGIGHFREFESP